ncbi:MAG: RdgB/HAM1 family non-canonical purine NTP pyrophosphatase [Cytophagaceae bacterium]|nr:RdgB/HAM1 family non-canonical purine NTP pyrophosphatase [Gemmatimonadaceae bacterium]
MSTVILATRSEGKVRELAPLFADAGYDVLTLDAARIPPSPNEDAIEAFETFEENALAKARHFFARSRGIPVIADDSGLVVEALGGKPGVHSKRWSGRADLEGHALDTANNAYLVEALRGRENRAAHYVCVAAFCDGTREFTARGETRGRILEAPRGSGGFGYDPYFWSEDLQGTFADISRDAKAAVSHRGRAVRALLDRLRRGR